MDTTKDQGNVEVIDLASLLGDSIGQPGEQPIDVNEIASAKADETVEENEDALAGLKSSLNDEDNSKDEEDIAATKSETSEKQTATSTDSEQYRQILKGILGDKFQKITIEEDGQEVEVPIDEMDLDLETFTNILKSATEQEKEEALKDKISVSGISDFTKRLIEIDKVGGDISDLLQVRQAYSDPLDQLDMTTPEGQREAIYLRKKAQGQDDEEITRLIRAYESEGILESKATQAETELRKAIDDQLELRKQQAEQQAKERQERVKAYKKSMKDYLGANFELNDNFKNKVVDLSTKVGEDGKYELDRAYSKFRNDPDRAAEMALYFLDRDEFIKQITNKKVVEAKLETSRKLKIVKSSSGGVNSFNPSKKDDDVISLSDLK